MIAKEQVEYAPYKADESQLLEIKALVESFLSEPYSVFCYRFFLTDNPQNCHLAIDKENQRIVGVIIGRTAEHKGRKRGYIGMLAVSEECRGMGIGSMLISKIIDSMKDDNLDEIVLETEASNKASLRLYQKFGFIRSKLLTRYYMSGSDAYRLKLYLTAFSTEYEHSEAPSAEACANYEPKNSQNI